MSRPQWTLCMLLAALAWALSALPAPRALAAADAHDVLQARACGWLDVADGSCVVEEEAPIDATVNSLRFRIAPAAPPVVERRSVEPAHVSPAPCTTVETLLRWREAVAPANDEAAETIVWLVPMASRWAQRPVVETAQRLTFGVTGDVTALAHPRLRRAVAANATAPSGIVAVSAAPWLGDRCPILMRVAPSAPSVAEPVNGLVIRRPRQGAGVSLAATLAGMAEILKAMAARLDAAAPPAQATAASSDPAPTEAALPWSQTATGSMVLGL